MLHIQESGKHVKLENILLSMVSEVIMDLEWYLSALLWMIGYLGPLIIRLFMPFSCTLST